MHSSIKFFCAALTAVLAVACAKAELENPAVSPEKENGGGYVTYTLTSELEQTGGTKVQLGTPTPSGDNYPLNWQSGDNIQVFCENSDTNPVTFTLSKGAETTSAEFTTDNFPKCATPLYAIFGGITVESPPLPSYSDNPEALSFFIPQEKGPQVGNISGGCFPAVAKIEDNAARFHNVFGLLEVKFSGDATEIKKIVLHDLAGNALWGTCKVPISEDNEGKTVFGPVEVTNTEPGANTISMTLSEAQSLNGASVYFPVPARTLDDGFSIVLYEYDATKTDGVGRAYSFLQKITGTAAMPRSGILGVTANVTDKHEAFNVNERGFYKSLFVNAGMNLDKYYKATYSTVNNEGIPAIGALGLADDYEFFASHKTADLAANDKSIQTSVIEGSNTDLNGVLLYPDGAPRFRLVYCNGGSSPNHGKSLTKEGRDRFKTFFNNGGSYSGSCAGSFLASTWVDNYDRSGSGSDDFTFGIFPGKLRHTHLPCDISKYPAIFTWMEILLNDDNVIKENKEKYAEKFPLLFSGKTSDGKTSNYVFKYSGTNGNYVLADVRHHGGSYLPEESLISNETKNTGIDGLEILMRYRYSNTTLEKYPKIYDSEQEVNYYRSDNFYLDKEETIQNDRFWYSGDKVSPLGEYHYASTWAYKPTTGNTGRAVCTGSHPEATNRDCDIQYTAFMFQYAMDGNGDARVKETDLSLGSVRVMGGVPESYATPEGNYAGIGDGQYHHFKFETSTVTDNFVLRLESQYDKNSGIDLYLGLKKGGLAWLSDADYTLCNKGGQKEIRIKHLPQGTWYVSVFCATKVEATATDFFPKYFQYSGKTEVLNGIPYSIMINSGYTGTAGENAPASDYGTGTPIGDDFNPSTKFTPNFDN